MQNHQTRLRARYAETDQMGVIYYAHYFAWMEVGRVELCRAAGFRYADMEREDGVLLAVAQAQCRYLAPARFDDEIVIHTRVARAGARMVVFSYEIRRAEDGCLLATAETRHLPVDSRMRRARLPEKYLALLGAT
jgi:acyl-CoA thioester hydrolase